ncbi:MAG: HEAT repeat domain-containing protein [Calditrichaeota bacterium]|nr:MAG: HEAT repeat domain-containing protein [Calditrichota bacterium]
MNKKEREALVADFVAAEAGSARSNALEKELLNSGYSAKQIEEFRQLYTQLGKIEAPAPSERMDKAFYQMLDSHSVQGPEQENLLVGWARRLSQFGWRDWGLQIAWSCALLFLGLILGQRWDSTDLQYENRLKQMAVEIQNVQLTLASTLLKQPSPVAKLQGMAHVKNFEEIDVHIADVLLQTLNKDPNNNVRMVALEALQKFTHEPHVRIGLVHSISNQTSPAIQLALVNIMVRLQEKNAVQHFQKLLHENPVENDVREKIEKSIVALL